MHHNYYFSPLVVALALGIAGLTKAAEPIPLQNISIAQLKQKFTLGMQGISATDSLVFIREHTDRNQMTHIRMQQQYIGYPVFGGYAILHSSNPMHSLISAKSNVSMNGIVYEGLRVELGKPKDSFLKDAPGVLDEFKAQYSGELSEESVTPMIYIDNNHQAHWAYKVSVLVTYEDKIPARPTAIIDAQTRKVYVQWDNVKTARVTANGRGFGGNHKIGVYQYNGLGLPYLEITRDESDELCYMENTHVRVIDMGHKYSSRIRAMKFNCPTNHTGIYLTGYKGDGYDKDNGAASPTNDALYAGYVIKHMYYDWYGVEVLTKSDGSPMLLIMRVHYGDGYENAYWDGRQMTFGDGDSMMYPLVSLGVGGHEVSHGFTEQHSDLQYYGQSGGMNESFSDMAAQAAEYYSSGRNSWSIGSEIMKEGSGYDALRYMDQPSRDGESIDSADEYYSGLDVHYSSGVYNRFFYILSSKLNWNTRLAFDVMVKANMDYWTPYSTFDEGSCGVISAAADFGYSLNDIKSSLKEVAINYDSCIS
jgi:pseudolysin